MMRKSWKLRARSGAVRRKVIKEYLILINKNSGDATPSGSQFFSQEGLVRKENEISAINASNADNITSVTKNITQGGSVCNENDIENDALNINNAECINVISEDQLLMPDSSSSDESDNENDINKNENKKLVFRQQIRTWAVEKNISQNALKKLAAIVNNLIPQLLPVDPRTILVTPRQVNIKTIEGGGEYWHNNTRTSLMKLLEKLNGLPDKISLNFNFDGLPIFKSSKKEFWPILCNMFEFPDIPPFVIGIYLGIGKPKNLNSYLEDFISDMKVLLEEGINHSEKNVTITIRCIICDSPARAFIKGVCNFNGKHGCLKCETVGEYSHNSHTVVFPDARCAERTDEGFRSKIYGAHHKSDSPLLTLPIDMVKHFPVGDSLHLIDLGIMKRLLVGWRDGNFGKYLTKWCARNIDVVNFFLLQCKLPSEIHRAVRGLDCLSYWKGSEFRSFFYYLSIIILPDVLVSEAFSHFLMLYCGITICSNKTYKVYLPLAKELLKYFVEHYKNFYGADYVTSNVHNLIHLTDEVEMFGPLQTFSAYTFENKLYSIKRMLRDGRNPLSQIAKRISEGAEEMDSKELKEIKPVHYPFITKTKKYVSILHYEHFIISTKTNDGYVLSKKDEIIQINDIMQEINAIIIKGFKLNNKEDVFKNPIVSSRLDIYKSKSLINNCHTVVTLDAKGIKCKLVCLKHKDWHYFIPLIHTL